MNKKKTKADELIKENLIMQGKINHLTETVKRLSIKMGEIDKKLKNLK